MILRGKSWHNLLIPLVIAFRKKEDKKKKKRKSPNNANQDYEPKRGGIKLDRRNHSGIYSH